MVSAAFKNVPQTTETTFALSSVFILLFCEGQLAESRGLNLYASWPFLHTLSLYILVYCFNNHTSRRTLPSTHHFEQNHPPYCIFITQQALHPRLPHPILPIQCQLACMHAIFCKFLMCATVQYKENLETILNLFCGRIIVGPDRQDDQGVPC